MLTSHIKLVPKSVLYWRKTVGCYREFGFIETARRTIREVIHALGKSGERLDISWVTERLAIGAAPSSIGAVAHLRRVGFTHIIDLRAERKGSDVLANTDDIPVHWVPTYDDWRPKPTSFFSRVLHKIDKIQSSNGNKRLFICCGSGEHRAPVAALLALVRAGYSLNEAKEMIPKARPVAEILPAYESSLRKFLATNSNRNTD